jgi:hypothetical protein
MPPPPKLPVKAEKRRQLFLHKLSGLWVFLVDNAFFGANAITLFTGTPLICAAAFLTGGTGVFLIETLVNRDTKGPARRCTLRHPHQPCRDDLRSVGVAHGRLEQKRYPD